MSSAPPSDIFLLPLESGSAEIHPKDPLSGCGIAQETGSALCSEPLFPARLSSDRVLRQVEPPAWFVGDGANDLLRILSDLTQLDSLAGPVVLYGPPQTGKSVLAETLAKRWARNLFFRRGLVPEPFADQVDTQPLGNEPTRLARSKAICLSAFEWSSQLQEALDTKSLPSFHNRLLQAGAVMLDDLQQLHSSPFSQAQLVQLIDRLTAANVPFVCTLPAAPHLVSDLRADLTSRLLGGLVLPVDFPGQSAREKLARDWAREMELGFSPAGFAWLLKLSQTHSYSGLLGTLRNLQAAALPQTSCWEPADLQARLCLSNDEAKLTWPELIIATVAEHFELDPDLIRGRSRRQTSVLARGLAMTLIRALGHYSLAELGSLFSNRDHSTVLNALESTEKKFFNDDQFRAVTSRLLLKLEQIASLHRLPFSIESLPAWLHPGDR